MSANGMSAILSTSVITAVCKMLDAYDLDGEVDITRPDGETVSISGAEAKSVMIRILAGFGREIAENYEALEGDDDAFRVN